MVSSQGIFLNIDFRKAFDRVEHNFLWAVLNKFGFGQSFISKLQLLYSKAESKVKCNGHFTDYFRLHRSVRQGCPLSSLLYCLVAEPLAILIRQDKNIQGIKSPQGNDSKIFQFADDTSITVKDENSLELVIKHLQTYGSASGAKINTTKSEIMYCGGAARTSGRWKFREVEDTVKVLGVYLGKQWRAARDETWKNIINTIQKQLNLWNQRKLTIKGKVVIINSLIISKIIYPLSVYDLPKQILNKFNSQISLFIWKSRSNLVSHKTMIAPGSAQSICHHILSPWNLPDLKGVWSNESQRRSQSGFGQDI
uniref:Reverse transcriptase domain-containing protein n=1 Tax=Xiphophorus couchianus TaxID=32473 RepID=A0A3B5LBJ5_9TELE